MRIGILADIHDAVAPLRVALARLREADVDRVVTLGDAFETFERDEPGCRVAELLSEVGATGVWGNHDVGLSMLLSESIRKDADPDLLRFAATLQPQLSIENCRFSHVEHWLDPQRIEDLWYYGGVPDTPERVERSFEATTERFLFMGHHHRWMIVSSSRRVSWDALTPMTFHPNRRYFIIVDAVVNGWCALFDTESEELVPIRCSV